MSERERDYYRARAAAERGLAKIATHPEVVRVHEELACYYEARLEAPSYRASAWRLFLAAVRLRRHR